MHILRHNGVALSYSHGVTDEGDPWFGYYNANNGDQLFHIARIDGAYVACRGLHGDYAIEARSLQNLIEGMAAELPMTTIMPASKGNKPPRLFMHPASLLGTLVATAFLLGKSKTAEALDAAAMCKIPPLYDMEQRHGRINVIFDQTCQQNKGEHNFAILAKPVILASTLALVLGQSSQENDWRLLNNQAHDANVAQHGVDLRAFTIQDFATQDAVARDITAYAAVSSMIAHDTNTPATIAQIVTNLLQLEHPHLDAAVLSAYASASQAKQSQLLQYFSGYEITALHAAVQKAQEIVPGSDKEPSNIAGEPASATQDNPQELLALDHSDDNYIHDEIAFDFGQIA
ncbi:MAG: hypothetical protein AAF352_09365, partial [Pseudomonadota bacterium]